ncbi:MAG: FtsX-like permease family protein [Acidobacteria bacterium]|nr:MAG: FtsX-like permease family protein [Acidobacteriota bacterium]
MSESLARKEWPDRDPLGMRMKVGRREALFRVVGVVGDVRSESPETPAKPTVYLSSEQAPMPFLSLAIRTSTPEQVVPVVRQVVHGLDSDLPLGQIRTLEEALASTTSSPRLRAYLVGAFSLVSLLLAAMGLYAVVSTAAFEREKEMGIRMALGASPRAVLRLLVSEGAVVGACGAALGVIASVLTARFTNSLLFEVAPNDARVLATTTLVLLAVTLFASYAPTRRASRLDPVTVLKSD